MHPEAQSIVLCPKCGEPQPGGSYNIDDYVLCRGCRSGLHMEVFPALYRTDPGTGSGSVAVKTDEASCFYHPANEAVVPCDMCGRFLCSLCDVEMNDRHICPTCFERGMSRESMPELITKRVRYDNIALSLAIYPLLIWFITFITAPMVIFMCIRYWKRPLSVVPVTRVRFVFAFIIAALQVGMWGTLAVGFFIGT